MNDHPRPPTTMPPPVYTTPIAQSSSKWPKVIGIVMIAYGALGVLNGCMGVIAPFFMEIFAQLTPASQRGVFNVIEDQKSWLIAGSSLSLVLETVLIILGIGLLKCRRSAARKYIYWAIPKIPLVLFQSVFQYKMGVSQMQSLFQSSDAPAIGSGFINAISLLTVFFVLIWGCTLPVFLLIWFNRSKIKAETVAWS